MTSIEIRKKEREEERRREIRRRSFPVVVLSIKPYPVSLSVYSYRV